MKELTRRLEADSVEMPRLTMAMVDETWAALTKLYRTIDVQDTPWARQAIKDALRAVDRLIGLALKVENYEPADLAFKYETPARWENGCGSDAPSS